MTTLYQGWTPSAPNRDEARIKRIQAQTAQLKERLSSERFDALRLMAIELLFSLHAIEMMNGDVLSMLDKEDAPIEMKVENYAASCDDVDFLAEEHRPETAAAIKLEEYTLADLVNSWKVMA